MSDQKTSSNQSELVPEDTMESAWSILQESIVRIDGRPLGTMAARDGSKEGPNYNQVFTRDFAVSAMVFLMRGDYEIVRNFLTTMVELQSRREHSDCFVPGRGLMPASFAIKRTDDGEKVIPDFGERAIGRVAPIDSVFWWMVILHAYVNFSDDTEFVEKPEILHAIELIVELSITTRFDMFPTLLVPDGGYMIDRRMGVYGYPFDMQALFFTGLLAARTLLPEDSEYQNPLSDRIGHLTLHIHKYYWLDFKRLNTIHRYKIEQYGDHILNVFNIHPASVPDWVMEWIPEKGGYFLGNIGPGRMDFRYFSQGNLLSVLCGLANNKQADAILDLYEAKWPELVGEVPLKVCYPALEDQEWFLVTGADSKNFAWSYHNGGNWPFLLWLFVGAALRMDRPGLAKRALTLGINRLQTDDWPEYYDGRDGRFVGREARSRQTWTVAGFLAAVDLVSNPSHLEKLTFDHENDVLSCPVPDSVNGNAG